MLTKQISSTGLTVSKLGLGCMGMSEFYGDTNDAESIKTIELALENGINLFDTANIYGMGENEKLVGRALRSHRDQVIIASKFGIVRDKNDPTKRGVDARPETVVSCCEESLRRLNIETLDLFYLHRLDYNTPIEDTVGAMARLVEQGKIRYIGLSEADTDSIKKAHSVHPLSAVQAEYSLWTRHQEKEVIPLCRELGIGFIAYSPLGRGFLTGAIKNTDTLANNDFRRTLPRLQGDNLQQNLQLVANIEKIAAIKQCTPAQLALAWVLSSGDNMVPIFGTKRPKYLMDNIGAIKITLTQAEIDQLNEIAPLGIAKGNRYTDTAMQAYNFKD